MITATSQETDTGPLPWLGPGQLIVNVRTVSALLATIADPHVKSFHRTFAPSSERSQAILRSIGGCVSRSRRTQPNGPEPLTGLRIHSAALDSRSAAGCCVEAAIFSRALRNAVGSRVNCTALASASCSRRRLMMARTISAAGIATQPQHGGEHKGDCSHVTHPVALHRIDIAIPARRSVRDRRSMRRTPSRESRAPSPDRHPTSPPISVEHRVLEVAISAITPASSRSSSVANRLCDADHAFAATRGGIGIEIKVVDHHNSVLAAPERWPSV